MTIGSVEAEMRQKRREFDLGFVEGVWHPFATNRQVLQFRKEITKRGLTRAECAKEGGREVDSQGSQRFRQLRDGRIHWVGKNGVIRK